MRALRDPARAPNPGGEAGGGWRLARRLREREIEDRPGQHAQQAADERHRPRQHVEALAARDRARDRRRRAIGIHQERHPVRVPCGHRRRDVARAHGDDAHAARAQLDAQALEQFDRRGLRRRVRRRSRDAAESGDARDADERPAPRGAHRPDERMERVDDARDVGVEHRAERLEVLRVLDQRSPRNAGVGDHDVGHAVLRVEIARGGDHRARVANVDRVGGDRRGRNRPRDALELLAAPRHEPQRRTASGIVSGERLAQPGGCAGQEDPERHVGTHRRARRAGVTSDVRRAPPRSPRRARRERARACRPFPTTP